MNINLEELLPEDVSDETAFHIANVMMDLALAVESHYFTQIRRHCTKYRRDRYKRGYRPDPF